MYSQSQNRSGSQLPQGDFMSNDSKTKAKNPNERKFAPKAGPNSMGFKGRKKVSNRTNNPTLIDELNTDRKAAADKARAEREAKAFKFRVSQAILAKDSSAITSMKEGSLAHQAALLNIEEFPVAEAVIRDGKKISRTNVAIELMRARLNAPASHEKAVVFGINRARAALSGAFDKLA